jgi:outer membrane protein assembly factor BamE (lipoprotein component of BamABCDE complex)
VKIRPSRILLLQLLLTVTLTSCISNKNVQGYTIDSDLVERITPHQSTKDDTFRLLGSPSSESAFGDKTWYYISSKSEYTAFFAPEVTDQNIVAIHFNDQDVVESVERYNKDDIREIEYSSDETPTRGNEIGVAEQLLGNVGKFNSPPGRQKRPIQKKPY